MRHPSHGTRSFMSPVENRSTSRRRSIRFILHVRKILILAIMLPLFLGLPNADAAAGRPPEFRPVFNMIVSGGLVVVDTLSDAATADGLCSLREAIMAANTDTPIDACAAGNGVDIINVSGLSGTLDLASALPDISQAMSILGPSDGGLTIRRAPSATSNFRLLTIQADVTLADLTLEGGRSASGAGIYHTAGMLTLERVKLADNHATSSGGGIFHEGGSLAMIDSTLSNNEAGSSGAGLYSRGGDVSIRGSALLNNLAGSSGGGLSAETGSLTVTNTTIDGNIATSSGGGIYIQSADLSVRNVTVSANQAGIGGGISSPTLSFNARHALLAGNTGGDCAGVLNALAFNLVQTPGSACTISGNAAGVITGQDPLLDPLTLNSPGKTPSRALEANSPARDSGTPAGCEPDDQRGIVRPQGAACDIGAYEVSDEPIPPPIVPVDPPLSGTVLRGHVLTDGVPLPNVEISLVDIPGALTVLTHADGTFDYSVEIGSVVTLSYHKQGYLDVQRKVTPQWQDYTVVEDVSMTRLDTQATEVALGSPDAMQVAQGSMVSDGDGDRQATLLIPAGTTAQVEMSDGTTQPLGGQMTIRATEYTVGDAGVEAMPGELPSASGYTYAVEYTADEALAEAAVTVTFNQPIFHYVENFLGFPVGMDVPVGYYDRKLEAWVPSDNGRVIAILSVSGGMAQVDTDGNGTADNLLGMSDAERQKLAGLYQPGDTLWRVPITHFTPWDCNWPFGPPPNAVPPQEPPAQIDPRLDNPCIQGGSVIECENQTIGETIPVVGSPYTLNYRSDRMPDRKAAYTLDIPLTGSTLPLGVKAIELEINIAGRLFSQRYPADPNQRVSYVWDGLDSYGRPVSDGQVAKIRTGYVYDAVYRQPGISLQSFGAFGGIPISGSRSRNEVVLWQESERTLMLPRYEDTQVGGWTLDVQHRYDPVSKVLYLGDGSRRSADTLRYGVITTLAGTGTAGFTGDGGAAASGRLNMPVGIAIAPDRSIYIADFNNHRVRRIDASGVITTIAGTGIPGYNGDGIAATDAHLNGPNGVAIAVDGSVIVTEGLGQRVRRIAPDGTITTIAGNGLTGDSGDNGLAVDAELNTPNGPFVAPDGNVYFADTGNHRVRRIAPGGIITTIAGTGTPGYSGDGGQAVSAVLNTPRDVAVGSDGAIYIADSGNHRVRRIGIDGLISTVVGNGTAGFNGDGGAGIVTQLNDPEGVAVGTDGAIYITDAGNHRLRLMGSDGVIRTVAGTGTAGFNGDDQPGGQARISSPNEVALDADGSTIFTDSGNHRIRRVAPTLPGVGAGNLLIPSDGGSVVYVFNPQGRHLATLHGLTGATLLSFGYDSAGRLTTIVDPYGNVTTIERNGLGQPTGILSPYSQHTTLTLDTNGYLSQVIDPAGQTFNMTYTSGGLLTAFSDPRGNATTFTYDNLGRLLVHADAENGSMTLSRMTGADGSDLITRTTAMGVTTQYDVANTSSAQTRINTLPTGLQTQTTRGVDGTTTSIMPDGSTNTLTEGPDPRWGMLAPLASSATLTLPGGQSATSSLAQSVTLTDTENPFSVSAMTSSASLNGDTYTSSYNGVTHTFTTTTPVGRSATQVIDGFGRLTSSQAAGLAAVIMSYDARGRLSGLTQVSSPDTRSMTFAYDGFGRLSSAVDPLSRTVTYTYDPAGRITTMLLPGGRSLAFTYDAASNLTSLTPPGQPAHTFTYNDLNQITAYNPPDVNPGTDSTTYEYDLDHRLTRTTFPTGEMVDLSYDSAGRLDAYTTTSGSYDLVYDAQTGNLVDITTPDGTNLAQTYSGFLPAQTTFSGIVNGSVSRLYDNDLRVSSISVNGANPVAFAYDADGQITSAGALSLTYNSQNGLLTGSTIGSAPNQVVDSLTYNAFGEVASYSAAYNASALYNTTYTRDKLGRITTLVETIGGVTTTFDYSYDTAGRLAGVNRNGVTVESYSYDLNGNRTSATVSGVTSTATVDTQDRLLTYGGAAFTYDANGALLTRTQSGQTTTYDYDVFGNLLGVDLPDGRVIDYQVNGAGQRVGKLVNGVLTQGFLWQSDLRIAAELDSSGSVVSRFVYATGVNVPDTMLRGGNTYRLITDPLGSVRLVINVATGQIVQRMDYDSWGNVTQDTNPGFQPFGFAGGLYDPDTGLVRFGARDYDARIGRWTTKDSARFAAGDSLLYGYVMGDPRNYYDPAGNGRFAKKPLIHPALRGTFIEDLLNIQPVHEHYFFNDGSNVGFGPGRYNDFGTSNDGLFSYGSQDFQKERGAHIWTDTYEYDDEVMREALNNLLATKEWHGSDWWNPFSWNWYLIGHNCQDFASALRREYWRVYQKRMAEQDINRRLC